MRYLIVICLCLFQVKSNAQLSKHLKKVLKTENIGTEITLNRKETQYKWRYLGVLSTKNERFHVVTEFVITPHASTWQGFSFFYLIDFKKKIRFYNDEWLPFKVMNDLLYFKRDKDDSVYSIRFNRDIDKAQYSDEGDIVIMSRYK